MLLGAFEAGFDGLELGLERVALGLDGVQMIEPLLELKLDGTGGRFHGFALAARLPELLGGHAEFGVHFREIGGKPVALAGQRLALFLRRREGFLRFLGACALRQTTQAAGGEREKIATNLAAKDAEIRDALAKIAQAQEQEKAQRTRTEEVEKALAAAQEKSQTLTGERDRLSANLAKVNTEFGVASEQLRQARSEREAVKSSAGSIELQFEQGLDHLHAVESERDALKSELEAVKAGLERAKQHVNVLQGRRDQMRDEIARLKVALGQAPDAIG